MEGRALLPGLELANCQDLAVPADVMQHVVRVESSYNPYAIGVVGGRLARQPRSLPEALATVRMLERRGYNFSLGLAQVNRYNLERYGLASYAKAFDACPNLRAGARILAECNTRAGGDWGKAFSCYYAGDFSTGYRHGYVQKIFASMRAGPEMVDAIPMVDRRTGAAPSRKSQSVTHAPAIPRADARIAAAEPPPPSQTGAAARTDDAFVF
jgi:type IV secretion system protein VirB1